MENHRNSQKYYIYPQLFTACQNMSEESASQKSNHLLNWIFHNGLMAKKGKR